MGLSDVLAAYTPHGLKSVGRDKWRALCVAHGDRTPSLDIGRGSTGNVVVICRSAGCKAEDIMAAVGLHVGALFEGDNRGKVEETQNKHHWPVVATYKYEDANEDVVFRVEKLVSKDSGAKWYRQNGYVNGRWQSNMDGVQRVLYRLPRLLEADPAETVYLVEGEKCADALTSVGAVATTNPGGAGKWDTSYSETLRGRNVVIIPDNDDKGEKHGETLKESLTGVAASIKTVRLPGVGHKGDVFDWITMGGTLAQLRELVIVPEAPATHAFASSPSRLVGEAMERKMDSGRLLSFGVRFLDDALGGIEPRDVILLGAKTGVGKTSAATIAAMTNAKAGKRVHYFALEAENREIERRVKYQIVAREHYKRSHAPIRYLEWKAGLLGPLLGRYDDMADAEVTTLMHSMYTFYRSRDFTADDFTKEIIALKGNTDLIVLDHLHYLDTKDDNENRGYRQMVKQIRDAALSSGKPVVVVAHVRKSDRRDHVLVPTIEDFHGSSDIGKIATKAIMIAPDMDSQTNDKTLWSTYMQVAKCRTDSSLTRYAARLAFDVTRDTYADHYTVGRIVDGGTTFNELTLDESPTWSKKRELADSWHDSRLPSDA